MRRRCEQACAKGSAELTSDFEPVYMTATRRKETVSKPSLGVCHPEITICHKLMSFWPSGDNNREAHRRSGRTA